MSTFIQPLDPYELIQAWNEPEILELFAPNQRENARENMTVHDFLFHGQSGELCMGWHWNRDHTRSVKSEDNIYIYFSGDDHKRICLITKVNNVCYFPQKRETIVVLQKQNWFSSKASSNLSLDLLRENGINPRFNMMSKIDITNIPSLIEYIERVTIEL